MREKPKGRVLGRIVKSIEIRNQTAESNPSSTLYHSLYNMEKIIASISKVFKVLHKIIPEKILRIVPGM